VDLIDTLWGILGFIFASIGIGFVGFLLWFWFTFDKKFKD